MPLQERVRQRLKTLVEQQNVGHEVLANHLRLSRSNVTRLLNDEGMGIALPHIERLCEFFQITPSELVAEPGALIQPVSTMEAALLSRFRKATEIERHSWMVILDARPPEPTTRRRAKLGRVELTEQQQLVVDLFARSDARSQDGVLKVLRGSAKRREASVSDDASE